MNLFFSILSSAYIFGIFYWSASPAVSLIGVFNPWSLLHIPLYGILTIFLLLALASEPQSNAKFRHGLAAFIATGVGILDEYYQSFIPTRNASAADVFLDILGVFLVMILARRIPPFLWLSRVKKLRVWRG